MGHIHGNGADISINDDQLQAQACREHLCAFDRCFEFWVPLCSAAAISNCGKVHAWWFLLVDIGLGARRVGFLAEACRGGNRYATGR